MESSVFFGISSVAYIFAMMFYITYIAVKKPGIGVIATTLTIIGFASHTLAFLLRWKEFYDLSGMGIIRSVPLTNLYESLIFFVWCVILAYLVVEFKYRSRSFGAFITPIAGIALAFIDISGMSKEIQPLVPALQSNWLLIHVLMSFIAYSGFGIAFSTALMYLILATDRRNEPAYIFWTLILGIFAVVIIAMGFDFLKFKVVAKPDVFIKSYLFKATFLSRTALVVIISWLSALGFLFAVWRYGGKLKKVLEFFSMSQEVLDEITYKSIAIGFPIFTLGGLIFGAIWADQAWGTYWSWDPKETWSLITWFVYAFYLHARLLRGWKGRKITIVSVIGFVAVIFTYLGVNLLLSGLHAYGSQ